MRAAGGATDASTVDELDLLLEEAGDEEEALLRAMREARLKELGAAGATFGSVIDINGQSYVREVCEAGEGVWVCLLLYKTDLPVCCVLQQHWAALAPKHPHTKFVQSVGQSCIPNYPDKNLPTVFVFHENDLKAQYVGPMVFGGEAATLDRLEAAFSGAGAIKLEDKARPKLPMGISLTAGARREMAGAAAGAGSDSDED